MRQLITDLLSVVLLNECFVNLNYILNDIVAEDLESEILQELIDRTKFYSSFLPSRAAFVKDAELIMKKRAHSL